MVSKRDQTGEGILIRRMTSKMDYWVQSWPIESTVLRGGLLSSGVG
jgi:hypothetical protein